MVSYTLEDYDAIIFSGFSYTLPENISNAIKDLYNSLGITETTPTLVTSSSSESLNKDNRLKNKPHNQFNKKCEKGSPRNDTWERLRAFQATKLEKKEGMGKLLDDIRTCLNKISNKNYETQRENIMKYIVDIMDKDMDDDDLSMDSTDEENPRDNDMNIIANSIFDTASANKFYSQLYAMLYKDLIQKYPLFQSIIPNFLNKYIENVENIKTFDPNLDYDSYCDNNKINEKRKAMSMFIVNLMIKDILREDEVVDLIIHFQNIIHGHIDTEGKTGVIDEIAENIFILVTSSISKLSSHERWNVIVDNVSKFSKLKSKEHVSLSSRSSFKHMDILDIYRKSQISQGISNESA